MISCVPYVTAIFNIQLKMPAYTGSSVAVWIDTKGSRGEGIYATAAVSVYE
jgi:hypothetical protein